MEREVVLAALVLFVTPLLTRAPFFSFVDFGVWRDDWLKLSGCIRLGALPCDTVGISKFPLAYLLNSYYASVMGGRGFDPAWALGLLNTLFLGLPIAFIVLFRGLRASLRRSLVYVVAILLSAVPPFYIYSGALEVQSGVVIGIFMSSLVLKNEDLRPPRETALSVLLFITALLLPLYKDTNILVLSVGLAVAVTQAWFGKGNHPTEPKPTISRWRRTAWALVTALSAALAISLTYNFVKGGSVLPLAYLNEVSQASPRPVKILEFFAATYFSPNGGVVVFWGCALCATVWLLRGFELEISRAGASVALAVALIYSVILSCWWVPFGWDAWGDRLMVPAMLATVICLTVTARERSLGPQDGPSRRDGRESEAPRRQLARVVRDGAIVVLVLPSLYFTVVSYYADRGALFMASLYGGPRCALMVRDLDATAASVGLAFWRSDSYYACARERFIHVPVDIVSPPRP
jgi:hypothetical protein